VEGEQVVIDEMNVKYSYSIDVGHWLDHFRRGGFFYPCTIRNHGLLSPANRGLHFIYNGAAGLIYLWVRWF
jgi:hypothetical protein